ncbi:hypothetical protein [Planctomyces sp. SH-PL14]|uniref:hypothetical protein n=1 Tax=Planctomyces sp. SH-PL14 TaxID=1632864 RepID=UPI0012E7B8E2|nr:hypothetical protein [Planctomyces sp. SH-PL14]
MIYADAMNEEVLGKAKAKFQIAMQDYREGACDWFDKREGLARESGDKRLVDQLDAERVVFEENDTLPAAAPNELKRPLKQAQTELEGTFRRVIARLTRAKNDADADRVEKELAEFKATATDLMFDRLQVGTVWRGVALQFTQGKLTTLETRPRLTVLERMGGEFTARAEITPGITRIVKGHVKGRRIWWTKEDVTVEKGPGRGVDNFGYLNGTKIRLRFGGQSDGGAVHFGLSLFELVPEK